MLRVATMCYDVLRQFKETVISIIFTLYYYVMEVGYCELQRITYCCHSWLGYLIINIWYLVGNLLCRCIYISMKGKVAKPSFKRSLKIL